jgi:probable rRNA maturation factor
MQLDAAAIRLLAGSILDGESSNPGSAVTLVFVRDPAIREYNRTYLSKDRPTDVISFQAEADEEEFSDEYSVGDVIISVDRAAEYAEEHNIPVADELARYIIHGILHCLGHDDIDPGARRTMLRRQEMFLRKWRQSGSPPVCRCGND